MQDKHIVPVPRVGQPQPSFKHQSGQHSEQLNAWLREDQTQMPWHNLALIVVSPTTHETKTTSTNDALSQNAATQGSAKAGSS
ncbi:hypothetical protein ACJZ2D_001047 [Fusarium nematophilum]